MRIARFALALGVLASAAAVSAKEQPAWQPATKWVLHYDGKKCSTGRSFARGDQRVVLSFMRNFPGEYEELLVQIRERSKGMGSVDAALFVGGERLPLTSVMASPSSRKGFSILSFNVSKQRLDALVNAPSLRFRALGHNVELPVTEYSAARTLLDDCEQRLLEAWGFSRADQQRIATYPKGRNLAKIVDSLDYPVTALDRLAVGLVGVRGTIGTDGRPKDCAIVNSSGHPDLDATTCRLFLERGEFTPAMDKQGQPMVAPALVNLRWMVTSG